MNGVVQANCRTAGGCTAQARGIIGSSFKKGSSSKSSPCDEWQCPRGRPQQHETKRQRDERQRQREERKLQRKKMPADERLARYKRSLAIEKLAK